MRGHFWRGLGHGKAVAVFCQLVMGGCSLLGPSTPGISVVRQTIDRDYYASAQVLSPDPLATRYPQGERLVLAWSIPADWCGSNSLHADDASSLPLHLEAQVYYRNRERETFRWPVDRPRGTLTLDCLGESFQRRGGWMTYRVQLLRGAETLLSEPHQLWFEWIELEEPRPAVSSSPAAAQAV